MIKLSNKREILNHLIEYNKHVMKSSIKIWNKIDITSLNEILRFINQVWKEIALYYAIVNTKDRTFNNINRFVVVSISDF